MNIGVAVSGGVDSLCALLSLKAQKHNIIALHGLFFEKDRNATANLVTNLQKMCAQLQVPLQLIDLRTEFRHKVLYPTLYALHQGETPNPCALCNKYIKFGSLLKEAQKLGCDMLATGHYATLCHSDNQILLQKAYDKNKDQSYFLSLVHSDTLKYVLFPLSQITKSKCKQIVTDYQISIPSPSESQDVCFMPKEDTSKRLFFEQTWSDLHLSLPESGPIYLCTAQNKQEIGTHLGLWRYTEGQRRGLGIAYKEGLYVLKKDLNNNSLLVGSRDLLGMTSCSANLPNIFTPNTTLDASLFVKVRYRQVASKAKVHLTDERLLISFDTPVFPTAIGQIASISDGEGKILAGGIINNITVNADEY